MVNFSRYLVVGVGVLVLVCTLWVNWGTTQANKQVDEANTASQAANALVPQAVAKYRELFSEANLQGYPGNRDQYKANAQEAVDLFAKSAEQYRLAANKLEEASKQSVKKPLSDYWTLKVQSFRKLADSKEAFGKLVHLLLDESIPDIDALNEKLGPLVDQATQLSDESDKLDAEAQKIQDANKAEFK